MNYLSLINQFWQLRREVPFSSVEADLYYYLLDVCNGLAWKNPFQQSNALIGATLGVSEKTLISARNRLKQYGLIDFQPGVKRMPSLYRLLLLADTLENTLENFQGIREECDSTSGSKSGSVSGRNTPDINKHKLNKTRKETTVSAPLPGEKALPKGLPVEAEPGEFARWQAWAAEHAPQVLRMKTPLTAAELDKLTAGYGRPLVQEVFQAMDNHAPLLKKYTSAYKTALDWCKRRRQDTGGGPAGRSGAPGGTLPPKNIHETLSRQSGVRL